MKMTEQQIIELITREYHPKLEYTRFGLIRDYARLLAGVSEKLNRGELAEMIALGARFYQMGLEERKAGIDQPAPFSALQKSKDEEGV
jgi:hypothetical protein